MRKGNRNFEIQRDTYLEIYDDEDFEINLFVGRCLMKDFENFGFEKHHENWDSDEVTTMIHRDDPNQEICFIDNNGRIYFSCDLKDEYAEYVINYLKLDDHIHYSDNGAKRKLNSFVYITALGTDYTLDNIIDFCKKYISGGDNRDTIAEDFKDGYQNMWNDEINLLMRYLDSGIEAGLTTKDIMNGR